MHALDELLGDLHYGLRSLRKNAGFSVVAVLSLALGIGATTSMFSLIYAVLLYPVPYAGWQRIVFPFYRSQGQPDATQSFDLDWAEYQQLLKASAVEEVVADQTENTEITGHDLPEQVALTYITENVSAFLGVKPLFGRNLLPSDALTGSQKAPVVLNYSFWMRHYDGDRKVLGSTLELDHKPYTIVGVMPKNYTWEPDIYVPLSLLPVRERHILPFMRLKPGVSLETANAEIDALLHQFAKARPRQWPAKFSTHLEHIFDMVVDQAGKALMLLSSAVIMLLIIGCANCSILLLARGMERQGEFALRAALGASRLNIVRRLLVEALLLAVSGSLLGIGLAYWMAKLILGLFPDVFMHESSISINLPVLAFSIGLAMLSGLIFALLPSLRISRVDVSRIMQGTGRKIAGSISHARSLNTLIAAQIALVIVIMGAAGIAINGFLKLMHNNFGYEASHVMPIDIPLHKGNLTPRPERAAYLESLRQKMGAVPGVSNIAIADSAIPPYSGFIWPFEILGMPALQGQSVHVGFIDSQYFSTLHIPLRQGRLWDKTENGNGRALVVINQTFAQRYFPQGNAIGRQVRIPNIKAPPDEPSEVVAIADSDKWMQIIGVVGDSLNAGLDKPVQPAVFVPYPRLLWDSAQMLIRTQGPSLAALHAIRAAAQSVNADQEVVNASGDLTQSIEQQPEFQQQRLFSILFGLFSALALILALVGLYSVVSYSVAQRTSAFGIRMALGASRSHILWMVIRNVGIAVSCGLAAGFLLFAVLHRVLMHWTQNSDSNPLIPVAVASLFLLCAALSCIFPALRAASVDPMQALRYE